MQFVSGPEVPVRHSHADPIIEMHRDCVYVPILNPANFWENTEWGLYDRDGCNIDSAAFYRYGKREGQSDHRDINLANIPYAPRKQYFYVGHVFNHYGHFICSTMARLWALSRYNAASMPLIGHAAGQPRDWFSWPHARTLFGSAGVMHEDFAHFDSPVRIRELIIARPAFVEGTHIHTAYARSMNYFGERLVKTENIDIHNDLIYLAKTKFGTKAAGISNENLIIEALEELGVQIVHPEQLTIPQQIALFHKSKKILGQVGSASIPTCLFGPGTISHLLHSTHRLIHTVLIMLSLMQQMAIRRDTSTLRANGENLVTVFHDMKFSIRDWQLRK